MKSYHTLSSETRSPTEGTIEGASASMPNSVRLDRLRDATSAGGAGGEGPG